MKKIKVLHTEWSDGWGGQEIRIINEMIAVREKGIEVFLACRDHAKIKEKAIENNIKVFTLPFRGNTDFKTLFGLMKIIKENKIDIVNTHSGKDTWVGGLAAKFRGAKFIRTRHLSNKINPSKLNFINEIADYIFTTGESVKDDMIKFNRVDENKIQSVPTGIDEELFDPSSYDKNRSREVFSFKEDEILVGIVAVLRSFKRHDLFLKAAKEILTKTKNDKIKFIIAGEGPQRESIEPLIKELDLTQNVVMLGHVNNVPELLAALDIFVLSSDSKEGVPQSVMQALLMNKPVVATDVGSTRDLYSGNNFSLIQPNDISLISNAVIDLLDDKEKYQQYTNLARESIIENFSKKSMVKNIIEIYEKIV